MTAEQADAFRVGLARAFARDCERDAARARHPSTADDPFTVDPSAIAWADVSRTG